MNQDTTNPPEQGVDDVLVFRSYQLDDVRNHAHDALMAVLEIQYLAHGGHRDHAGTLGEQVIPHAIEAATLLADHANILKRYRQAARPPRPAERDEATRTPAPPDQATAHQAAAAESAPAESIAATVDELADELASLSEFARNAMDVCVAAQVMHAREGGAAARYWRDEPIQWDDEELERGVMAARLLAKRVKTLSEDFAHQAWRLRRQAES